MITCGWSTEIRKITLKRIRRMVLQYPVTPPSGLGSPEWRDTLPMGDGENSECLAAPGSHQYQVSHWGPRVQIDS